MQAILTLKRGEHAKRRGQCRVDMTALAGMVSCCSLRLHLALTTSRLERNVIESFNLRWESLLRPTSRFVQNSIFEKILAAAARWLVFFFSLLSLLRTTWRSCWPWY